MSCDFLQSTAHEMPDHCALVHETGEWSYAELDTLVSGVAAALVRQGVGRETRVPFMAPMTWQSLVFTLAVIRAGAVASPLSTRNPVAAVQQQANCLGPHAALSEEAVASIIEASCAGDAEPSVFQDTRPATAVFTSGSTGTPRAALHSLRNHLSSASASNVHNGLVPGDRWLLSIPLYHVGGLGILFRCMTAGATVVLHEGDLRTAVATQGVTHLSLVPTQLKRLLDSPGGLHGLDNLKLILLGGAAIPHSLVEEAIARGLPVRPTYGMTETSSQVATVVADANWPRCGAQILSCNAVRIAEDGEIQVRGDNVFLGYLEGGHLETVVDDAGWLTTGDLGEIDAAGCLKVQGRRDRLIISGGENIHPEEIEAALLGLDAVQQVRVVAIEDTEFGQRPVAYVQVPGDVVNTEALVTALEKVLSRFKIPVAFHPWAP